MDGRFSYALHAEGIPELEHVIRQEFLRCDNGWSYWACIRYWASAAALNRSHCINTLRSHTKQVSQRHIIRAAQNGPYLLAIPDERVCKQTTESISRACDEGRLLGVVLSQRHSHVGRRTKYDEGVLKVRSVSACSQKTCSH
jgi:hypothetical protein